MGGEPSNGASESEPCGRETESSLVPRLGTTPAIAGGCGRGAPDGAGGLTDPLGNASECFRKKVMPNATSSAVGGCGVSLRIKDVSDLAGDWPECCAWGA